MTIFLFYQTLSQKTTFSISKFLNFFRGERAKNGGVLGEEIFCPRADGFSCPPPAAAGNSL